MRYYYKEHPNVKNAYVFTSDGNMHPYSNDLGHYGETPTSRFSVNFLGVEYAIVCPKIKEEIDPWGEGKPWTVYRDVFFDDGIEINGSIVKDETYYSSRKDVNMMCKLLNALGFKAYAGAKEHSYKYDVSEVCVDVYNYGYNSSLKVYVDTVKYIKHNGLDALPVGLKRVFFGHPVEIKPGNEKKYRSVTYVRKGKMYVKLYQNGCYVTYTAKDYLIFLIENGGLGYDAVLPQIARHIIDKLKERRGKKRMCKKMESIFINNKYRYTSKRKSIELVLLLSEYLGIGETM